MVLVGAVKCFKVLYIGNCVLLMYVYVSYVHKASWVIVYYYLLVLGNGTIVYCFFEYIDKWQDTNIFIII